MLPAGAMAMGMIPAALCSVFLCLTALCSVLLGLIPLRSAFRHPVSLLPVLLPVVAGNGKNMGRLPRHHRQDVQSLQAFQGVLLELGRVPQVLLQAGPARPDGGGKGGDLGGRLGANGVKNMRKS